MPKNWYKLDNAAKIFPVIYSKRDTNSFRLSAIFKDKIDKELLLPALEETYKRFPTFCVKLKRGFFWYYFEHNYLKPIISEEKAVIFDSVRLHKNNNFMLSVSYYQNRLSIEIFHALSDGTGGLEFFKSLCYNYLVLKGVNLKNDGTIKTIEVEKLILETEDSFISNYDSNHQKYGKESRAYKIQGSKYLGRWYGIVHAEMNTNDLKDVSKKYQTTITQYISACLLYSLYLTYKTRTRKNENRSIKLFIPVNARKFFNSKSLRNFVLYLRTACSFKNNEMKFEDVLEIVKKDFSRELTKDKMTSRLVSNVSMEKKFIIRILPLFIKNIAMKIGYKYLGVEMNSLCFSNLGVVEIPEDMKEYIERFEFVLSIARNNPINSSAISYNNRFVMSFSTKLLDRRFIQQAIKLFTNDGLKVIVNTNDLEVES